MNNDMLNGANNSAKSRLTVLQERFSGFEKQIELDNKSRKESEENRLNVVRDTISKLERTLNAEIKRRVEANKALQSMFENQILIVQEKLEQVFVERLETIQVNIESLSDRIANTEREMRTQSEQYQKNIEDKNLLMSKDLAQLHQNIEMEQTSRVERENQIVQYLQDVDTKMSMRVDQEKNLREQKFSAMRAELDESKRLKEKGDNNFQTFVLEEIATLKNSIVAEGQARESADEDIVSALNHYTKALQEGLRIINSV